MTRGTLFYYESDNKVWSSTEFNGDMYHGTPAEPQGYGDDVIKLMQKISNVDDFKEILVEINKNYGYKEGNDCYSVSKAAITRDIKAIIKYIDEERPDLRGSDMDPRTWKKKPSFRDVRTWQFWGTPNLSDYSYIYNNSGENLVMITRDNGKEMIIPDGCCGVLNYGSKDCLCRDGKIIDGMGNYKESPTLKEMDKNAFYEYIIEIFTLDSDSKVFIRNILDYVEKAVRKGADTVTLLSQLLDGIGLTDEEFEKVKM